MNEAELLFTELLDCDRLSLYLNKGITLDKHKSAVISSILKRRICGEPLEYILGKAEFMGLEFKVTPDVLIPRPETEILVETAQNQAKPDVTKILDLGTGSGCIAISLAKMLSDVQIDATDISKQALEIARINAELNGVKVNFIQSDLFNNHDLRLTTYDLIVSNPPYVGAAQINNLQPEVQYEPRIALDGGKDGLDFYRRIISGAADHLSEGGFLIMEMGFNQRKKIERIFQKAKNFRVIEVVRDYNKIDRVILAQKGQHG